jgi:DNA-binding LacI/PurR family transcriptional regulator
MIIAVAGKYSSDSENERSSNFDAMNQAAARLLEMGHTPLIGVTAALPVVDRSRVEDRYEAIMRISMAVISVCDAILVISRSPGADQEAGHFTQAAKPVYYSIDEVPKV